MSGVLNFVASYVYELPFFNTSRNLAARLLGHWQFSGITTFRSGAPDDVFTGQDIAGTGAGSQRAILVKNPNLPRNQRTLERMFDTSSAVLPAPGTLAKTGRNTVNGLGINNWDIAVFKEFPLDEQRNIEFRFETFNTFNHTQLAVFSTVMSSALFGQATSARNPRNAQASLKFRF